MSEDTHRPDPEVVETTAQLIDAMRRLKSWSGHGYRTLQKRARAAGSDLPRSTLTAALSRATLPRMDLVVTLTRVCGCDEAEVRRWIAAWRRVAAGSGPSPAPDRYPPADVEPPVIPAQLPAPVAGFVGRVQPLQALTERLPGTGAARPVSVVTVTGMAGVGKTALAVHWTHSVADHFPDGQLYVNLRGFAAGHAALSPADALLGFLDALSPPRQRIPAQFEAQIGLYRSLMAGRRMLVVLDNAFDDEQVLPLLPAAPGCMAVVTSRRRLSGLVAAGAYPVVLDVLTEPEARDLLTERIGRHRVSAEPEAVTDILASCVRLPLALSIVAARAATHPQFSLWHLSHELRNTQGPLDALGGGDARSDIRTVFSWSYLALSAEAARLFRLLGVHPGPDIGVPAAASIAGVSAPQVRRLLSELSYAHLVMEHQPGRFALHDLLRVYAGELAHTVDGAEELAPARHRMLDHYLHSACAADAQLYPNRDPIALVSPCPGVTAEAHRSVNDAMAWFTGEHLVLKALIGEAVEHGHDTHAWQLPWAMVDYLERKGHWPDWRSTQDIALQAAYRLADAPVQAEIHRLLGRAHDRLGNTAETHTHLKQALETGSPITRAHAHINYCQVLERHGRYSEGLDHVRQALALYRAAGHRLGQGNALNSEGWLEMRLGNHGRAIELCRSAVSIHEDIGHLYGQCSALNSIATAYRFLGEYAMASEYYERSLRITGETGDLYTRVVNLRDLADHYAAREPEKARQVLAEALVILEHLQHADAAQVRAALRAFQSRDDSV